MMRTDAMHGDAAHHDHIPAMIRESVAQDGGRVDVVTAEQAFLPEFAHALGGFAPMCAMSGAMPQAASRSRMARSNAAGSKSLARGMPRSADSADG
jgi:hypothetical protein